MAHWHINALKVTGDEDAVAEFLAACPGTDQFGKPTELDLARHAPVETIDPHTAENIWGCDRNAVMRYREAAREPGMVGLVFETANGTVDMWLHHAANIHPELRFDLFWDDPQGVAAGEMGYEGGRKVYEQMQDGEDREEFYRRFVETRRPDFAQPSSAA